MLKDAIRIVVEVGQASASLLQRKLKVGYSRAGRLIDEMEQRGVIGPFEGAKPRKVLITENELMEMELSTDE
jgi:S-DNA-T family DNA segregation ATPase FtsK/SpoIIIE